jgi:hypothetical protein
MDISSYLRLNVNGMQYNLMFNQKQIIKLLLTKKTPSANTLVKSKIGTLFQDIGF